MRNLHECQAEVFRRSEKRIKAQKKRTIRTLAIALPLVLCLAGIPLLTGTFSDSSRATTGPALHAPGGEQQESFICPVAEITVSGPDLSRSITEVSDILSICGRLFAYDTYSAGAGAIANETAPDEAPIYEVGGTMTANTATTDCTVTLVMHDGSTAAYHLAGSTLRNLATGQQHTLSEEDTESLIQLLGLPK